MKLFDACMAFVDTPLGFLVISIGIIGLGITIYALQMPLRGSCDCPRYDISNQDGTKWISKTYHRPGCEAAND